MGLFSRRLPRRHCHELGLFPRPLRNCKTFEKFVSAAAIKALGSSVMPPLPTIWSTLAAP
jgi:hypothetical protein